MNLSTLDFSPPRRTLLARLFLGLFAACFCFAPINAQAQNPTDSANIPAKTTAKSAVESPQETLPSQERSTPLAADAARENEPANTESSDPADWEILDEPVKVPSTPTAPKTAPVSPFSNKALTAIAHEQKLALPLKDARVEILKSERRLNLYSGSTLVKSYRVALGRSPVGHKTKQGDGRTPEGRYYICTRNAKTSDFHIFLGLSYPALPDAKRGVNNKQITWREYQIINQRLASRSTPLWETNLGGWVGIHGGTDKNFAQNKIRARGTSDWTAGCIALTDKQIEEIYAATKMGTPVDVRP